MLKFLISQGVSLEKCGKRKNRGVNRPIFILFYFELLRETVRKEKIEVSIDLSLFYFILFFVEENIR